MANQIKIRRDTASNFQTENPTLGAGEFSLETDTSKIKIGDGSTAYNSLQFIDGDAAAALTSIVQGSSYVYAVGGINDATINNGQSLRDIQRWSVSSDENATDIGDYFPSAPAGRVAAASGTSTTHGYISGGLYNPPQVTYNNAIYKFAFSSPHAGTDVGNLTKSYFRGMGSSSPTDGYHSGGRGNPASPNYVTDHNKYPFASDADATDNGDLTVGRYNTSAGNSSPLASYFAGGSSPALVDTIDKIPFTAGGTATDVGDLTTTVRNSSSSNSVDTGYVHSMQSPLGLAENVLNTILKFPYASDADATDSQDLFAAVWMAAGSSSDASGYTTGGARSPGSPVGGAVTNIIQKFPFANNSNGTDVGDLATAVTDHTGNQS